MSFSGHKQDCGQMIKGSLTHLLTKEHCGAHIIGCQTLTFGVTLALAESLVDHDQCAPIVPIERPRD